MRKFKCELCDGDCELAINDVDLEGQPLAWCPGVKALEANWVEVVEDSVQPIIEADAKTNGRCYRCSKCGRDVPWEDDCECDRTA